MREQQGFSGTRAFEFKVSSEEDQGIGCENQDLRLSAENHADMGLGLGP